MPSVLPKMDRRSAIGSLPMSAGVAVDGTRRRVFCRVIFYVTDVDAFYARAAEPNFVPPDAPYGERYSHLRDPDGY
jgi:uncharacterized glyoxalase superfamily protein PhnB